MDGPSGASFGVDFGVAAAFGAGEAIAAARGLAVATDVAFGLSAMGALGLGEAPESVFAPAVFTRVEAAGARAERKELGKATVVLGSLGLNLWDAALLCSALFSTTAFSMTCAFAFSTRIGAEIVAKGFDVIAGAEFCENVRGEVSDAEFCAGGLSANFSFGSGSFFRSRSRLAKLGRACATLRVGAVTGSFLAVAACFAGA